MEYHPENSDFLKCPICAYCTENKKLKISETVFFKLDDGTFIEATVKSKLDNNMVTILPKDSANTLDIHRYKLHKKKN